MFFEKTKAFDLEKHFDPNHPDVRIKLRELFKRTRETIARERHINLEVVLLIGCLEAENAAVNLGIGKREDLAKRLGLTANQYWKRAQAGRVLFRHPEFIDLITKGETHVSHIAILASKITAANKEVFLKEICGKSEREIRELAASVNKDGSRIEIEPTIDIKLSLTKAQLALLERAREVLSANGLVPSEEDVVIKALNDLIEKRDPMKKAERALLRKEKKEASTSAPKSDDRINIDKSVTPIINTPPPSSSLKTLARYVPAEQKHQVYQRDKGHCAFIDHRGRPCLSTTTLQVDHVIPVALNGSNEIQNLRLLCREHNVFESIRMMGKRWALN